VQSTARKNYSRSEGASHAMLVERLGTLYRDAGQYNDAVESFRQIAALDSESAPRAAAQIIDTYRTAKDYDSASREAEAAYKKYPKDRTVAFVHASLWAEMGKTDEAVSETKALLKGQPDLETLISAARVYDKAKRYSDEAKVLDEAEKLAMSRDEKENVAFMRGAMYERTKKYEASEAEFRKVLALNPDDSGALNYLGYMLANRGQKLDEASQMISRALQLEPDNAAYLDSLGWAYYQQGKLAEAEAPLLRAIEKMGEDPTVHDHLGDLYLKQGKTKEAIQQWQTSLQRYRAGAPSDLDSEDVAKINKKLENARVRLAKESNQ